MKKYIILILVFLVSGCIPTSVSNSNILRGTYLCNELSRVTIVFDPDDNYKFYYYNSDLPKDKNKDVGTFSKISDSKYIIKSSKFNNIEIIYKKNGFKIKIKDKTYLFKQFSSIPSIVE